MIFSSSQGSHDPDYPRSAAAYTIAAEGGDAVSQFQLGYVGNVVWGGASRV